MSTFDTVYQARVGAFKERRDALHGLQRAGEDVSQELRDLEDEERTYLLRVGPILKDYVAEATSDHPRRSVMNCATVESTNRRGHFFTRYMAEVEESEDYRVKLEHYKMQETSKDSVSEMICEKCDVSLVKTSEDYVCPACATSHNIDNRDPAAGLSFEQRMNEVTPIYSYKRSNHFGEWLSKLQGKEATEIPVTVLDAVRIELKKIRIKEAKDIDQKRVKAILKKLKLSKYFDHVAYITNLLTGCKAPEFSPQLERELRCMFDTIQAPFQKYCPKNRKNFLSYSYTLYKFCELLEADEYLKYLPLLKSTQKLYQQDVIWKQICEHLNWQFIPSV
jgi:rubrerythrin